MGREIYRRGRRKRRMENRRERAAFSKKRRRQRAKGRRWAKVAERDRRGRFK